MENIDLKLDALVKWLGGNVTENLGSGAFISPKISVRDVPGSGRGIYAESDIGTQEELVRIPVSFLLNFTTAVAHITKHNPLVTLVDPHYQHIHVPSTASDKITDWYAQLDLDILLGLSSFQLLAIYLVLEKERGAASFWKPFIDMLPAIEELSLAPVVWKVLQVPHCDDLWRMLSRSARKHAESVVARFEKDYAVVCDLPSVPAFERLSFLWAWMCINSRCLYMLMPQAKDTSDNFTMAPYVDFLNHLNEDQCGIKIDPHGFHVLTSSAYKPQEELYFSYGPHSNEFLLCEYGFTLPHNKWNYIDITDFILPLLRPEQVSFLKDMGYYGDYTVNTEGMSFRTEIALATLQESEPQQSRKLKALVEGMSDGAVFEKQLKVLLRRLLDKMASDSGRRLHRADNYDPVTTRRIEAVNVLHKNIVSIAETILKE